MKLFLVFPLTVFSTSDCFNYTDKRTCQFFQWNYGTCYWSSTFGSCRSYDTCADARDHWFCSVKHLYPTKNISTSVETLHNCSYDYTQKWCCPTSQYINGSCGDDKFKPCVGRTYKECKSLEDLRKCAWHSDSKSCRPEVQTKISMPDAARQRMVTLDSDLTEKISNHGCWCSSLMTPWPAYRGGSAFLDGVDFLCKRWFHLKRCITLDRGACHGYDLKKSYSTEYSFENGEHTCGASNDGCQQAACELDSFFMDKIAEYMDMNPDWEVKVGSDSKCPKPSTSKWGNGDSSDHAENRSVALKMCVGDGPESYKIVNVPGSD